MGYPIITNLALNEFTDDIVRAKSLDGSETRMVTFKETTRPKSDGKPIYPIETGLVPHYTGHIPGIHIHQNLIQKKLGHWHEIIRYNIMIKHCRGKNFEMEIKF